MKLKQLKLRVGFYETNLRLWGIIKIFRTSVCSELVNMGSKVIQLAGKYFIFSESFKIRTKNVYW